MVALAAPSREAVDKVHADALANLALPQDSSITVLDERGAIIAR